jgi:predicted DNA-binding transcriptional regulator AlpA
MASSFKSSRLLSIDDGAEAPRNSLLAHASATIATALGTNCNSSQLPATQPTELLTLAEVELRTKMKSSNIYRLIKLGLFPRPIKFGGAKWIAAEVEEYVQRQIEERDRERDPNNFVPRPSILSGNSMRANGAWSEAKPGVTPGPPASAVRMLGPDLSEGLRLLKVDIPELYLDPATCNVVLAVIKIDLPSAQPAKPTAKGKMR